MAVSPQKTLSLRKDISITWVLSSIAIIVMNLGIATWMIATLVEQTHHLKDQVSTLESTVKDALGIVKTHSEDLIRVSETTANNQRDVIDTRARVKELEDKFYRALSK